MKIVAKPPFDFDLSTSIFARFTTQVSDYYQCGKYRRVLNDMDSTSLVEVQSLGGVDRPILNIRTLIPENSDTDQKVIEQIRWILATEFDLTDLYEIMDHDPVTHRLKQSLYGLKPPRTENMFEALITAIIEQQISLAAALAIRDRLVKIFGQVIAYAGIDYMRFPCPENLAKANAGELLLLGLSKRKANVITTVTDLVLSGKLDLETVSEMPIEEALGSLTSIIGIGPWTVQYMLCRGAGRYDAVPFNDLALAKGIGKWYGDEAMSSPAEIENILSRFGNLSGYAAFYFIFSYAFEKYPVQLIQNRNRL